MIPTKEEMKKAFEARHGEKLQKAFSTATAAVCGLGGLGSNISVSLARAGIGKLILIDYDRVDVTNLHRQQYNASQTGVYKTEALADNLKEIMPYTEYETHTVKITEDNAFDLLKNADVICEAFDNAESKAMLANFVLERFPDKYLVSASGCGDGVSDVGYSDGLFSARVMLCAAHQAQTVLRILAGEFDV